MEAIQNFLQSTGFAQVVSEPLDLVMIAISCVLLYLAIVKKFEPLLLLPIAFGMLLTNLPGAGMYHSEIFANGRKAGHLSLPYLHRRGRGHRFRPPYRQPEDPAPGRRCPAGHLHHIRCGPAYHLHRP